MLGDDLKKISKEKQKKERFVVARMWFSTAIASIFPDRGTIPKNIGNNIQISNNMYIVKNSINTMIIIKEFSDEVPVGFCSELITYVKDTVSGVLIDTKIKCTRHYVDTSASGLGSRMNTWEKLLNNPFTPTYMAKRAARLLHTVDVIRAGETVYKTKVYITIRTQDGLTMRKALAQVTDFLNGITLYKSIKNNLQTHLEHSLMMSDSNNKKTKDIPYSIMSNENIAELLPVLEGMNDRDGTLLGMIFKKNIPYFIDFRSIKMARNVLIEGLSGFGKTFLATTWLYDMYNDGFNIVCNDIKGNELSELVNACRGITVNMKANSSGYVNTFKWFKGDVTDGNFSIYAMKMFSLSIQHMFILAGLDDSNSRAKSLLEEFLQSFYAELGCSFDNYNTWFRTEDVTPYIIYEKFCNYLSVDVCNKYGDICFSMRDNLSRFMSPRGSLSYIYKTELNYRDLINTKALNFSFGMNDSTSYQDTDLIRLRIFFMNYITEEYLAYKFSKREWTANLLEESQAVEEYIIASYVNQMTMGRSRLQVNFLLGNSVSSLFSNDKARAMLENITIKVFGKLHADSRQKVTKEFDLNKEQEDNLRRIAEDSEYENTFMIINSVQKEATSGLIKADIPDDVVASSIFNPI